MAGLQAVLVTRQMYRLGHCQAMLSLGARRGSEGFRPESRRSEPGAEAGEIVGPGGLMIIFVIYGRLPRLSAGKIAFG